MEEKYELPFCSCEKLGTGKSYRVKCFVFSAIFEGFEFLPPSQRDAKTTPFYSHNKQFSYICHVTVRDTLQYQMVSSEGKEG